MASLRGTITSVTAFDLDGRTTGGTPHYGASGQIVRPRSMPVETVMLTLVVDYVEGDVRDLLGASLAIAPHEEHQRALARMHDQRAERAPTRAQLLEPQAASPLPPDAGNQLADDTAARARELEVDGEPESRLLVETAARMSEIEID